MSGVVSNPWLARMRSAIRTSFNKLLSFPAIVIAIAIAIARIEFASGGALVRNLLSIRTMRDDDGETKGFLWRLPKLQTQDWGKMGPAFGYGIGCGVGLGVGLVGGAGVGLGFPGLQVGFGAGAGCGVGVGFGYGLGKGRAYDDNGTYSNIGRRPKRPTGSIAGTSGAEIGSIVDDIVSGLKRALSGIQNNGKRP